MVFVKTQISVIKISIVRLSMHMNTILIYCVEKENKATRLIIKYFFSFGVLKKKKKSFELTYI